MSRNKNPFMPDRPVEPKFFVGREDAIQGLKRIMEEVIDGRLKFIYLRGEKGIGKTSLALFFKILAERELAIPGIHFYLGDGSNSISEKELTVRIVDNLLKSNAFENKWLKKFKSISKFIQSIELPIIKINYKDLFDNAPSEAEDLFLFLEDFMEDLRKQKKKGILIIIDEIDKLEEIETLSIFTKRILDEAGTNKQDVTLNVAFLLCGTEETYRTLYGKNKRIGDILEVIDIDRLEQNEVHVFFKKALGQIRVDINYEGLNLFYDFCHGYPQLMHLVGSQAFNELDLRYKPTRVKKEESILSIKSASEYWARKHLKSTEMEILRHKKFKIFAAKLRERRIDTYFNEAELIGNSKLKKELKSCIDLLNTTGFISKRADGNWYFRDRLLSLFIQNIGLSHSV